ncbi:hypothetical protein AD940_14315 [Gluconobacter thailandicus]|uniref:hypothetical protein n=1 Tax=Gluconobacter thailandicus TaxID=257438 RepID=UPI000777E25C|nr:hypothetical protein [Gluconobacter thailandicus]KXV33112.1 hypothetical protein AD940_14315 [Gluconobacter thailandicus]
MAFLHGAEIIEESETSSSSSENGNFIPSLTGYDSNGGVVMLGGSVLGHGIINNFGVACIVPGTPSPSEIDVNGSVLIFNKE